MFIVFAYCLFFQSSIFNFGFNKKLIFFSRNRSKVLHWWWLLQCYRTWCMCCARLRWCGQMRLVWGNQLLRNRRISSKIICLIFYSNQASLKQAYYYYWIGCLSDRAFQCRKLLEHQLANWIMDQSNLIVFFSLLFSK